MDIHPIFVHFPIALLTVYAFMELLRFEKLTRHDSWNHAKAGLAIIGVLAALVTLSTGEGAEETLEATSSSMMDVVEVHAGFAGAATAIFAILAAGQAILIIDYLWLSENKNKVWWLFRKIKTLILAAPVAITLAIAGLIAITVTGALGGAIVYGPDIDPVVNVIYHLFF